MLWSILFEELTMASIGTITMSMQQIERLKVIQAVIDGHPKPMRSTQRLAPTTR